MLHKFRFVIAGIVFILVNQVVTFAVSASMANALLPAGTTRYAAATASDSLYIAVADGWKDITGMTKYITIPGGQKADVFVIFCGGVASSNTQYLNLQAYIGGTLAGPGIQVFPLVTTYRNQCALFQRLNVPAGSPAIKLKWSVGAFDNYEANMAERSMIVIANLH